MRPPSKLLCTVDGTPLPVRGEYTLPISVLGRICPHTVFVVQKLSSQLILGFDFIKRFGLSLDAGKGSVFWSSTGKAPSTSAWKLGAITCKKQIVIPAGTSRAVNVKAFVKPGLQAHGKGLAVTHVDCVEVPVLGHPALVEVSDEGEAYIMIDNPSDVQVTIPRNAYIGGIERIDISEVSELKLPSPHDKVQSKPPPHTVPLDAEKRKYLNDLIDDKVANIPSPFQNQYRELLWQNADVFSSGKYDLGYCDKMEHEIKLKDDTPVYVKQFRIPEAHRTVIIEHLNEWLKMGIVKPSSSRYNSPIFAVDKKDGSLRPVLDFRGVNEHSQDDKYSGREIRDAIDELGRYQSKIFSSLDMTSGFWQMKLAENSRPYTAFTIPGLGSFEWNVCPMGLKGLPSSFGRLTESVVQGLTTITYQDDNLPHSKNHEDHLVLLQEVFNRFRGHGLKLNLKKCFFGQTDINYLGFRLTPKVSFLVQIRPPLLKPFKRLVT